MNLEQRKVGFRTILELIKQRPLVLIIGTSLTVIPILFGGLFLLIISTTGPDVPVVDYELISTDGSATKGMITNIEIQRNIVINEDHPAVVSYSYKNGDQELYDKYKILIPSQYTIIRVGDEIDIKYLGDKSVIAGKEPFVFPTTILYMIIPLLIVGLVFLGFVFWQLKNQIALYKNGRVVDAKLISMTLGGGLPISGFGQRVVVNYLYKTSGGQEVIGKSVSTDYRILTSMKRDDDFKIFVSVDNELKSCLIPRLDQIRNNWKIS